MGGKAPLTESVTNQGMEERRQLFGAATLEAGPAIDGNDRRHCSEA
jgi:hypothetical protein